MFSCQFLACSWTVNHPNWWLRAIVRTTDEASWWRANRPSTENLQDSTIDELWKHEKIIYMTLERHTSLRQTVFMTLRGRGLAYHAFHALLLSFTCLCGNQHALQMLLYKLAVRGERRKNITRCERWQKDPAPSMMMISSLWYGSIVPKCLLNFRNEGLISSCKHVQCKALYQTRYTTSSSLPRSPPGAILHQEVSHYTAKEELQYEK